MWRSASGSSSLSSFGGTVGVGEGSTVDGRAVLPFGASSQSGQSGWSVGGGLLLTFFLVGGVGSGGAMVGGGVGGGGTVVGELVGGLVELVGRVRLMVFSFTCSPVSVSIGW